MKEIAARDREPVQPERLTSARPAAASGIAVHVLSLQRAAGNRAVASLIHAQRQGPLVPKPKLTLQDLIPMPSLAKVQAMSADWAEMDAIKSPIARKLAQQYVGSLGPETPDVVLKNEFGRSETDVPRLIQGKKNPSEERVYLAIYRQIDLTKTGKGYSATDWTWKGAPIPKTPSRQTVLENYAANLAQDLIPDTALELAAHSLRVTSVAVNAEGATILANVLYLGGGAIAVLGVVGMVIGVVELAKALGDAAAPKPSYGGEEGDLILVAKVKDFLENKQRREEFETNPLKPMSIVPTMVKDNTQVVPTRPPPRGY